MPKIFSDNYPTETAAIWRDAVATSSESVVFQQTASDAFLRDVLQTNYKTAAHYVEAENPQRLADLDNLIQFATLYEKDAIWSAILTELQQVKDGLSASEYVETLLQCLQNERLNPGHYFAYHAFSVDAFFATQVMEILTRFKHDMKPDMVLLRGGRRLFGGAKNIDELLTVWGQSHTNMGVVDNYAEITPRHLTHKNDDDAPYAITTTPVSFANVLLSANAFLLGCPDLSTSCTATMFHNDQTRGQNWRSLLAIAFEEEQINISMDKLEPFWKRFKLNYRNNFLWQIKMTPEVASQITYLSRSRGPGIANDLELCRIDSLGALRNGKKRAVLRNINYLQMRIGLIPEKIESLGYQVRTFAASSAVFSAWQNDMRYGLPALTTYLVDVMFLGGAMNTLTQDALTRNALSGLAQASPTSCEIFSFFNSSNKSVIAHDHLHVIKPSSPAAQSAPECLTIQTIRSDVQTWSSGQCRKILSNLMLGYMTIAVADRAEATQLVREQLGRLSRDARFLQPKSEHRRGIASYPIYISSQKATIPQNSSLAGLIDESELLAGLREYLRFGHMPSAANWTKKNWLQFSVKTLNTLFREQLSSGEKQALEDKSVELDQMIKDKLSDKGPQLESSAGVAVAK